MLLIIVMLGFIYADLAIADKLTEKAESRQAKEDGYELYICRY